MSARSLGLLVAFAFAGALHAAEVIPAPPAAHFNDYASLVSAQTAQALDVQLADFERQTSNQVVVVIYPKMESDSSVEDYTVRVAQAWHVGMKGTNNGAILFIFSQSHQIYLQVGYGLEGSLPDVMAKRIIADEITPRFRKGDFDGGVSAAVNAIIAATKGEYRGTGRTTADRRSSNSFVPFLAIFIFIIALISIVRKNATMIQSSGRRGYGGPWIFPGGGFGGGGGGGFGGGGGGGGFSGGGGSFGGGGAGGSW